MSLLVYPTWDDIGADVGAAGGVRGVEALTAADAANGPKGEAIEETILEASAMGWMDGSRFAVGARLSVAESGSGEHDHLIGNNLCAVQSGED